MEQPIATLPFLSEISEANDPDKPRFHFCLYRYDHNACEHEGAGLCDTVSGLYYGSEDPMGGKLCPRHFYEDHFGPDANYSLID